MPERPDILDPRIQTGSPDTTVNLSTPSGHGSEYDRVHGNPVYGTDVWDNLYAQYMQYIERYKGTSIYQQLLDNPYVQFQAYEPGFFEGMFGQKSGYTDFYNSRFTQAYENANQLIDELRQQSYNSPASQQERYNAAGINTDLNGGAQVTPGAAGDASPAVEQNPVTPDHSHGNEIVRTCFDMAGLATRFFTGIMDLAGSFQKLGLNATQQGILDVQLGAAARSYVLDEEAGRMSFPMKQDGTVDYSAVPETLLDPSQLINEAVSPFRGRAKKAWSRARGTVMYDKEGKPTTALRRAYLQQVADASGSAVKAGTNMATPGYNLDPIEMAKDYSVLVLQIDEEGKPILSRIQALEERVKASDTAVTEEENANRLTVAQATGRALEYTSADGSHPVQDDITAGVMAGAKADRFTKEAESIRKEYEKWLESAWHRIYDLVTNDKYGRSGRLGTIMLPGIKAELDLMPQQLSEALSTVLGGPLKAVGGKIVKAMK